MTPNGPRFSSGRSGLGSQVSMWLGPPAIHSRMTLLPSAVSCPGRRLRLDAQQVRQAQPGETGQAGLEHVAPAQQRQTLAFQRVEIAKSVRVMVAASREVIHGFALRYRTGNNYNRESKSLQCAEKATLIARREITARAMRLFGVVSGCLLARRLQSFLRVALHLVRLRGGALCVFCACCS